MADASVDAVITDPPYSARTHDMTRSNSKRARAHGNRVLSGNFGFDHIDEERLRVAVAEMARVSRGWVIATMDYRHAFAFDALPPAGLKLLRIGVWVKKNPNPQISGDRPAQGWEAIAYMHRADARPRWNGGGQAGNYYMATAQSVGHPTAKPLPLVRDLIRKFTSPGATVFDPFAGSGTTLVAARDEGRRAVGVELDEGYCDLIVQRLTKPIQPTLFGGDAA